MSTSVFRRELRELFRLGLPLAAAQAGTQLMGLVDVAVLGRLGARELAASGLGNAVFFAVSVIGMGLVLGVDPLISQAVGSGDRAAARRVLWQGVWLACFVTAALTLILLAGAAALPLLGARELVAPARVYLLIRIISLLPFLLFFVVRAYLQAHHRTVPMLVAMVTANVANLLLDVVLVFGGTVLPDWTGPLRAIPALGVAGAAIATVTCAFLQLAILVAAVAKVEAPPHVDHTLHKDELRHAFEVGLPIGLHMGAEVGIFALVALLAARLGTLDLAAHQLVIGVASFTFTVAVGVAAAGTVRVGIGVGARDREATRSAGHAAFLAGIVVMGVSAAVFAFAPRMVARLITDEAEIIEAAIPLMFIAAFFQVSDGIQAVGAGVLRGAGDTKYTLYANLVGHWAIGVPVAVLLGFTAGMGVAGLWWGLCAGLTVVAVLLFVRFEKLSVREIEPLSETMIRKLKARRDAAGG